MTPDGLVYSLLLNGFQDRQPWDMSEAHSFTSRDGDTTWSLRDVLKAGCTKRYEAVNWSDLRPPIVRKYRVQAGYHGYVTALLLIEGVEPLHMRTKLRDNGFDVIKVTLGR